MKNSNSSSKITGNEFEDWLIKFFKRLGDFPRKMKNSGAVRSEPDIVSPYITIEAKATKALSFRVDERTYKKLGVTSSGHEGIRVLAVSTLGDKFFVLSPADFAVLYKIYLSSIRSKGIDAAENL